MSFNPLEDITQVKAIEMRLKEHQAETQNFEDLCGTGGGCTIEAVKFEVKFKDITGFSVEAIYKRDDEESYDKLEIDLLEIGSLNRMPSDDSGVIGSIGLHQTKTFSDLFTQLNDFRSLSAYVPSDWNDYKRACFFRDLCNIIAIHYGLEKYLIPLSSEIG